MIQIAFLYSEQSFALFAKRLCSIFEHHLSSLSENRKISKGRKWRRKNLGHLIFWSWSNFFWKKNTEESNIWSKSHSFTANKVLHYLQKRFMQFFWASFVITFRKSQNLKRKKMKKKKSRALNFLKLEQLFLKKKYWRK